MPKVKETVVTFEKPCLAMMAANSSGGGKVPTEAGK